jgi:hypothetical protein
MTSYEIRKNPDDYDHDSVHVVNGLYIGFIGRATGRFGLERCPECHRQNYSMAVLSGRCACCGHAPDVKTGAPL